MIHHLAIPALDIDKSLEFYRELLLCDIGRRSDSFAIINFFGMQLVLHLSHEEQDPSMYPRHFGVILSSGEELLSLWDRWRRSGQVFSPLFCRYEGKKEQHSSFFLKDPANNTIEFKWYLNDSMVFGGMNMDEKNNVRSIVSEIAHKNALEAVDIALTEEFMDFLYRESEKRFLTLDEQRAFVIGGACTIGFYGREIRMSLEEPPAGELTEG